jgi:acyl dehydratase
MNDRLDTAAIGAAVAARSFGPFSHDDLRRYAEASGDLNPLHLDPGFARQAGFDDVIVHGMLGMAVLGRMVTDCLADRPLKRFRARFRSPIPTGRAIECLARLESREGGRVVLALTAAGADGTVFIEGTATVALSSGN